MWCCQRTSANREVWNTSTKTYDFLVSYLPWVQGTWSLHFNSLSVWPHWSSSTQPLAFVMRWYWRICKTRQLNKWWFWMLTSVSRPLRSDILQGWMGEKQLSQHKTHSASEQNLRGNINHLGLITRHFSAIFAELYGQPAKSWPNAALPGNCMIQCILVINGNLPALQIKPCRALESSWHLCSWQWNRK